MGEWEGEERRGGRERESEREREEMVNEKKGTFSYEEFT